MSQNNANPTPLPERVHGPAGAGSPQQPLQPGAPLPNTGGPTLRVPHSAHSTRSVDNNGAMTGFIPVNGQASAAAPVGPTPPGSEPLIVEGNRPVLPENQQIPGVAAPAGNPVRQFEQPSVPLPQSQAAHPPQGIPNLPPGAVPIPQGMVPPVQPGVPPMGGQRPPLGGAYPGYGYPPVMPPRRPVAPGYPGAPGMPGPGVPPGMMQFAPYGRPGFDPMTGAPNFHRVPSPYGAPGMNPNSRIQLSPLARLAAPGTLMSPLASTLPSRRSQRQTPEEVEARQLEVLREAEKAAREAEVKAMMSRSFMEDEEVTVDDLTEFDWDDDQETWAEWIIRKSGRWGETILVFGQAMRWAAVVLVSVAAVVLLVIALDANSRSTGSTGAQSQTEETVVDLQNQGEPPPNAEEL